MVRYRHQLNGHEFEQIQRDSEGQRSLACCSPRGHGIEHNLVTEQQQQQRRVSSFMEPVPTCPQENYVLTCVLCVPRRSFVSNSLHSSFLNTNR